MIQPGRLPLVGNRWTPFVYVIPILGIELTGVDAAMQVRAIFDGPGAALVALTRQDSPLAEGLNWLYAGTDTVANHVAARRLPAIPAGMASGDDVALSILQIRINETTMKGLPFPDEIGDDAVLAYDLQVTASGLGKQVWFRGSFTVRAGATQ